MDWSPPAEPVDEESFSTALEQLLGSAHQNGIAVNQDWPCRGAEDPDWDVEIVRLAPDSRTDEG